jgi:hypothetical protein
MLIIKKIYFLQAFMIKVEGSFFACQFIMISHGSFSIHLRIGFDVFIKEKRDVGQMRLLIKHSKGIARDGPTV